MFFSCFNFGKKKCGHVESDHCECPDERKPLDINKYATKKTIAQGMLDIALLTANASQLKYILQVGRKHEFYSLMLGLISTSLILQVLVGILLLSLNFMRDCRLHLLEYKTSATYINYVTTALSIAITAINLLISAFDPTLARFASSVDLNNNRELLPRLDMLKVIVGVLFLVIGGLDIKKPHEQTASLILNDVILLLIFLISLDNVVSVAALNLILSRLNVIKYEHEILSSVLNHIATGCAMLAMVSDVIKMSFGLDPALSVVDFYREVVQAIAGVFLGSAYNINKEHHHISANFINNFILASNVVIVALNAIISSFSLKDESYLNQTICASNFVVT